MSSGAVTSGCAFKFEPPGEDAAGPDDDDAVDNRWLLDDASSALLKDEDGSDEAEAGDFPLISDHAAPEGPEEPGPRRASASSRSKYTGGMGVTSSSGADAFVVGDPNDKPS